ncbi:MAG: hypothetical protein GY707_13350 [Desulfobacteraceae bacterium]|nr:hypothetical protein [Desulfobacteraceae bacterium]
MKLVTNCFKWSVKTVTVIYLFMLITGIESFAQGPTAEEYGSILNLSGKQRMLTQKMSKEIIFIALNFNSKKNLFNLEITSDLFDDTLKGLRDGDEELSLVPTVAPEIIRQLDKVQSLWEPFYGQIEKIISSGSVSKEQLNIIAQNNLELLVEMNKCVKLYEKDASKAGLKSNPALAVTINLSGKQRMLTQKMAKEFLLIAIGHDVEKNKLNLQETFELFEKTLTGLLDGDSTLDLQGTKSETIRAQLGRIQVLWKYYKPYFEFAVQSKSSTLPQEKISAIAKGNLGLLKEMNDAVLMYEISVDD